MDGGEASANRQGFLFGGIQGACLVQVACVSYGGCVRRAHGARLGTPWTLSRERRQRRHVERIGISVRVHRELRREGVASRKHRASTQEISGGLSDVCVSVGSLVYRMAVSHVDVNKEIFGYTQMPVDHALTCRTRDV